MQGIGRATLQVFLPISLLTFACGGRVPSNSGSGGASNFASSAGAGGRPGGSAGGESGAGGTGQAGAGVAGGGASAGGSGGMFCGLETCAGDNRCCPATGRCYDPLGSSCPSVGCAVAEPSCSTSSSNDAGGSQVDCGAQSPAPSNCCPDGLSLCETNNSCYYSGCSNCCPPNVECNQQSDCPTGFSCCYNSRRCYNPQIESCSSLPPKCAADGSCPGEMICCAQYGTCYEPGCTDCCSTSCAPSTAHCAEDLPCCSGTCCSGIPIQTGHEYCAPPGSSCPISDRNVKRDIVPVDPELLLQRVLALPISEWSYQSEASARHIGPMAQDFHAAFATGTSDKCIPTVDENGVALAAIQALYLRVERLDQESRALQKENAELRQRLERLAPRP
jgi:hypothetical protein